MSFASDLLSAQGLDATRFTSVFLSQLEHMVVYNLANPFAILAEIRALEGLQPTRTKVASAFKRGPLNGIMHKHFCTAHNIAHNLRNAWSDPARIERVVRRETPASGEREDLWAVAGRVARRLTWTAFEQKEKAQGLTGDWIVYRRHDRQNYYLCLAVHGEPDDAIFERLVGAAEREFPKLGIRRKPPNM